MTMMMLQEMTHSTSSLTFSIMPMKMQKMHFGQFIYIRDEELDANDNKDDEDNDDG